MESLKAQAERLGIGKQVIFHGAQFGEKKIALLKGAKLFISASRNEPYSNAMLEAMAAGLPVISSAVDGNFEIIRHGVNGWLFPSDDSVALANLIGAFFADSGLQIKTAQSACEYIARHDRPLVAQHYINLYIAACRQRGLIE